MKVLVISFLVLFSCNALAISSEEVVRSSLSHFPKVIESLQKLEVESSKLTEAKGQFDGKIKGSMNVREDGYYNGDNYELRLEKPIPYFNSKVFGGRRQGFGQFPGYEGKYDTLNQGEDFVGLSISLLRNSLIDQNRYNIRYLEQSKEQARISFQSIKVNVQTMALKAYWTWFIKGHELAVYKDILDLAVLRDKKIKRRIKAGDLAKIYATENNQYILKRQGQVAQKKMEFQEASFYLSLFYRNKDGKPILPKDGQLPSYDIKKVEVVSDVEGVYLKALKSSLDLQSLSSEEKQAKLDVQLGTNDLLPKLDLKYEWSQDRGSAPMNDLAVLGQEESRIMLNLEVPLQFRKGKGKRRAGKAKLERIKTRQKWVKEKIKVDAKTLVTKLNSFSEIFDLTLKQVKLAEKLSVAERKKFKRGASDLILVNIREENMVETQIKNLSTLLKYHFVNADLNNLQVRLFNF